jgi:hypothetical protein
MDDSLQRPESMARKKGELWVRMEGWTLKGVELGPMRMVIGCSLQSGLWEGVLVGRSWFGKGLLAVCACGLVFGLSFWRVWGGGGMGFVCGMG